MGWNQKVPPESEPLSGRRIAAIALGAFAAAAAGLLLGLGVYAAAYSGIFPGVTVAGVPLGGMDLGSAQAALAAELPARLDQQTVDIYAGSEALGSFGLSQLGAYADAEEAARAAYAVGREPGPIGWLRNGWAMGLGLVGGRYTLQPEIRYDPERLDRAAAEIARGFDRSAVDGGYRLTEEGLFATKPLDGRQLDQELLVEQFQSNNGIIEAGWQASPALPLDMDALAQSLNPQPIPARYDTDSGRVVDGQAGVDLDPKAAAYALSAVAPGETILLPAEVTFPELTAQELEAVLFRDRLSTNTTAVSGTEARRGNVRLAAEAINGTVLNTGEIFDFNQVVGQRTTEGGYGSAGAYVNGETVDTVGGGICQVSSTLYLSALLADLEIVERYAHRYWPGYIELGMDATVSWGGPEFRFKNDTGYPIRIDAVCEDDKLTVTLYGTKTDDTYVEMTREVLTTTGYETEYVETEDLPRGAQEQKQSGYTGREVESYRNVYDGEGNLLKRTLEARSIYQSRNEIILVGVAGRPTGGGDTTPTVEETPPPVVDPPAEETPPPEEEDNTMPPWLQP